MNTRLKVASIKVKAYSKINAKSAGKVKGLLKDKPSYVKYCS